MIWLRHAAMRSTRHLPLLVHEQQLSACQHALAALARMSPECQGAAGEDRGQGRRHMQGEAGEERRPTQIEGTFNQRIGLRRKRRASTGTSERSTSE